LARRFTARLTSLLDKVPLERVYLFSVLHTFSLGLLEKGIEVLDIIDKLLPAMSG